MYIRIDENERVVGVSGGVQEAEGWMEVPAHVDDALLHRIFRPYDEEPNLMAYFHGPRLYYSVTNQEFHL